MSIRSLVAIAASLVLTLAAYGMAADSPRPADTILADIKALKMPAFDQARRSDQAYLREYVAAQQNVMQQRADLALELFKAQPDHPQVPSLMSLRWMTLAAMGKSDEVLKEAEPVAVGSSKFAADAAFAIAYATVRKAPVAAEPALKAIATFEAKAPGDERAASLLSLLANSLRNDALKQAEIYRMLAEKYPDSKAAAYAKGKIRQADAVGKPFELSFKEAITGKQMDSKDLKGKVLVIDFWATWCGPCVAEMPNMKKIYAEYKDKGVEFIGISLDQPEDQGGLQKLKDFVAKNQIGWPQYYQGNGWASAFSSSWGVNSIPCVFIVDKNGNLASTDARGKLEELIPALLK